MNGRVARWLTAAVVSVGVAAPAQGQPHDGTAKAGVRVDERVAAAQRSRESRQEQVVRSTHTLKLGTSGQLELRNVSGDITIKAGGTDVVTVEVVKRGYGATAAEATRQLELLTVEVTERAGRGEVRARYREGERNYRSSADYVVTAPEGTRVLAHSVSGNVQATGITGEIDVNSVSGDIRLEQAGRVARAKTISGTVEIVGYQTDGTLEASSVSGDVQVADGRARRVELTSVSGDIEVTDVTCEAADIRTTSGSIRFVGVLQRGGRYTLRAHSGDVRISVPEAPGFEIDASTFSGSIESELPLTIGGERGGRRTRRALHAVYGDGAASLEVTSFSGSIIIRKR